MLHGDEEEMQGDVCKDSACSSHLSSSGPSGNRPLVSTAHQPSFHACSTTRHDTPDDLLLLVLSADCTSRSNDDDGGVFFFSRTSQTNKHFTTTTPLHVCDGHKLHRTMQSWYVIHTKTTNHAKLLHSVHRTPSVSH
jgi:hypothetical protein